MNIITVLNLAGGKLLKVINDYTVFNKDTLGKLLSLVEYRDTDESLYFFANGCLEDKTDNYINSFDDFLNKISYWCTYVGGFSISKKDFELIKTNQVNEMFPHTSLLFQLVNKKKYIVVNEELFTSQILEKKGGYDLFNVFGVQFFNMLFSVKEKDHITQLTFNKIKKDMFNNFFVVWYYNLLYEKNRTFNFESNNLKKDFQVYYSYWDYIRLCFLGRFCGVRFLKSKIKKLCKKVIKT